MTGVLVSVASVFWNCVGRQGRAPERATLARCKGARTCRAGRHCRLQRPGQGAADSSNGRRLAPVSRRHHVPTRGCQSPSPHCCSLGRYEFRSTPGQFYSQQRCKNSKPHPWILPEVLHGKFYYWQEIVSTPFFMYTNFFYLSNWMVDRLLFFLQK
jgi:hypothetical protein